MSTVETGEKTVTKSRLQALTEALEHGTGSQVRRLLHSLHPGEIARLLESFPHGPRELFWQLVDIDDRGEVLVEVNEEVRNGLIKDMGAAELAAVTETLDTDDMADLVQDLPDAVIRQVLQSMDKQNRHRLEVVLSYSEDTAGGLMDLDTVTVRADVTLDVVLRYLRLRGEIPDLTDSLFVVNRYEVYQGLLPLSTLLTQSPDATVAEVMDRDVEGISAALTSMDVAKLFEDRDLVSAPVVDAEGKLVGRITIDDVVDVIRDTAEHSIMSMAGLHEEDDIFAPVITSARRRGLWLGINLFTAFLASWVIGRFESVLEQIVALAVLMPIVASMGGVAGTQTLTIVTRGLALGQIGTANARTLMSKELAVGVFNGMLWAIVVGVIATLWFNNYHLGYVIAAAIVINLTCAALAGIFIPLLLQRVGVDPALAGSVVLTTVTDVIGFLSFLGLGTLLLL